MPPEGKRIVIIQGHPDPRGHHFAHALARAYADGAAKAGHEVDVVNVASLDFPFLRRPIAVHTLVFESRTNFSARICGIVRAQPVHYVQLRQISASFVMARMA